jgi:Ni,Fe-hydrogenase III large subunit
MPEATHRSARNGVAVPLADVPELGPAEFHAACVERCVAGAMRVGALVALPGRDAGKHVVAVLADDAQGALALLGTHVHPGGGYPSLTANLPQAQAFERELYEETGIVPEGHPWLKPLRRHAGVEHPFFRVEGSGVHEVAVGPVHAGVIEPGHFRFQCKGEQVLSLEIRLGYQHRGAEALLLRSTPARRLVVAESIAGDTAIGHATAYCMTSEALCGTEPSLHAHALRGIALELERLANHVGDLGALCNDVGYLPGASWFGRLRGEFLNLLMELSGNRFGRSLVVPGGVRFEIDVDQRKSFALRLAEAQRDIERVAEQTFGTASVASRFEHTGVIARDLAESLGLVGVVGRASGCDRDVRRDHPGGVYRFVHVPVSVADTGDVMARALVRRREIERSSMFVREQIAELRGGARVREASPAKADAIVAAFVEGWRGEIVHVAATGADGALVAYKMVDPSMHNWFGLTMALRGEQISDFPLCNKSFNLSYAGHDL